MRKVVYNACWGGFSLSPEAIRLGREFSGNPQWGGAVLAGEMYSDGSGPAKRLPFGGRESVHLDHDFPRHDPVLVKVVEALGEKASGAFASLQIAEVEGKYRIDEYDGMESVETPDSYDWVD